MVGDPMARSEHDSPRQAEGVGADRSVVLDGFLEKRIHWWVLANRLGRFPISGIL
jgi:hypothetical protein